VKNTVSSADVTDHAITITMHRIAIEDRKIGTVIDHA
jgi:hypothetical protein